MKTMFIKELDSFGYSHHKADVFRDWLEMIAIAFSNAIDKKRFDEREERYFSLIKKYKGEELKFVRMKEILIEMMERDHFRDHLGDLYMSLDFGNSLKGQFFTPYCISQMTANVTVSKEKVTELIDRNGHITVSEPSVGSGGMLIAIAEKLYQFGFNPQQTMLVNGTDIDSRCIHMAYIHLTLLGIPAQLIVGDTLTLESREIWYTPAYFLNYTKLRQRPNVSNSEQASTIQPEPTPLPPAQIPLQANGQLVLF